MLRRAPLTSCADRSIRVVGENIVESNAADMYERSAALQSDVTLFPAMLGQGKVGGLAETIVSRALQSRCPLDRKPALAALHRPPPAPPLPPRPPPPPLQTTIRSSPQPNPHCSLSPTEQQLQLQLDQRQKRKVKERSTEGRAGARQRATERVQRHRLCRSGSDCRPLCCCGLLQSSCTESARIAADSAASLAALDAELNGGADGTGDSQLDLTTRGAAGGAEGSNALDFLDFSAVDSDFARFQQNELVKEAVEKGRDLRAYAEEVETQLALHERKCVEDYLTDADDLASLHTQLRSCDSILATMESMLSHFQSDLSAISSEIESLQDKSYSMNIKLRNYKLGERSLNSYIQNIYIPDDLCNCILEAEIGDPYVMALKELDKKLRFLNTEAKSMAQRDGAISASSPNYSQAAKDMIPIGEKLKAKSVARIRSFLLERFHQLRKPKTNIQIKQKSLLKFAALYQFLLAHADSATGHNSSSGGGGSTPAHHHHSSHSNLHAPSTPSSGAESGSDICAEIRTEYQKTMSAIYRSKFGKYLSEMRKLQADSAIKESDTLASEGSTKGSAAGAGGATPGASSSSGGMGSMLSGLFSSKRSAADIDHIFRLNGRDDVLSTPVSSAAQGTVADGSNDGDLIIPHLASASGGKLPFAKLFKSAQSLLMDTATSEYDFIVEFFGERMQRDMDRAGVHEDALAAEKEADAQAESDAKLKPAAAAEHSAAAAAAAPTPAKPAGPSYALSPSDERGREHLSPHSRDKHLFALVFGDTFKLFQDHLADFLATSHDALGTLVLIRIVCQHNIAMQYRRVHCLDHVFDRENMMLWPKFKQTFVSGTATHVEQRMENAELLPRGLLRLLIRSCVLFFFLSHCLPLC